MPIQQNIPRKQGTINAHPYKKGAGAQQVFGPRGAVGANVGDVTNPGNPANLTASGMDYNNQISKSGGAANPVGNHSDTATQLHVPPLVSNNLTTLVPVSSAVDVSPHERGTFFVRTQPDKALPQRVSGGVDPNANTPFHPKHPTKVPRQILYPQKAGERTKAASFGSSTHLTGVTATTAAAHSTPIPVARWSQIKRGAAEAYVSNKGTLAGPSSGKVAVGSGTTGSIRTGSRKSSVFTNAHSGSPFVVAWTPNPRGVQPNEKGNTNPVKQPCSGGCN